MKRHLLFAAMVLAGIAISHPANAQDRRGIVWDNRPSIVFGEDINIDLKGRVQFDWRRFDPEVGEDEFDLRTLRVGLKGDLTRHFDWEIEREIDEVLEEGEVEPKWRFGQWKDVFINWTTFDAFSIKGGRFKMPFGLEQTTSVSDLDFAYRTLGSVKIAPGRDKGVMAYGELLSGSLVYEAGVFDDDGDNGEQEAEQFIVEGQDLEDIGPSVAVRVVGELFRRLPVHDRLKGAEFGIAYTRASVPEGLNSLQGEEVWGYNFFERVYVNGRRQRLGLQFDWSPGPLGFKVGMDAVARRADRPEQSQRGPLRLHRHGVVHERDVDRHRRRQGQRRAAEQSVVRRRHRRGRDRRALRPAHVRKRLQGRPRLHQPALRAPDAQHRQHAHLRRELDADPLGEGRRECVTADLRRREPGADRGNRRLLVRVCSGCRSRSNSVRMWM